MFFEFSVFATRYNEEDLLMDNDFHFRYLPGDIT